MTKWDTVALDAPLFVIRSEADDLHFVFLPAASGTTNYATPEFWPGNARGLAGTADNSMHGEVEDDRIARRR